jgi:hypothetical protein
MHVTVTFTFDPNQKVDHYLWNQFVNNLMDWNREGPDAALSLNEKGTGLCIVSVDINDSKLIKQIMQESHQEGVEQTKGRNESRETIKDVLNDHLEYMDLDNRNARTETKAFTQFLNNNPLDPDGPEMQKMLSFAQCAYFAGRQNMGMSFS